MAISRRQFGKLCLASAALAPAARVRAWGGGGGGGGGTTVQPFQVPLPLAPVLAPVSSNSTEDYYEITARTAQQQILPGAATTIWGYNGMYPGPTLKARVGRSVRVRHINQLAVNTTVHLHGGHVPPSSDGRPTDIILPGSYKEYVYPNNQLGSTLWYHDHTMDVTGRNVYMGLAAFYILQDDFELGLNLPSGDYDIPIVIQDRSFNTDNSLYYPTVDGSVLRNGFQGDIILVNGAVQPYFQVENRKYRFRILNGSQASGYQLSLQSSTGSNPSFVQIGLEGGLIPAPLTRSSITLYGAERADVVIDFSKFPLGTQITMLNGGGYGSTGSVMRFDVVKQTGGDGSVVPATLRPLATLPSAVVTRNITLDFDRSLNRWVLNGKPFDPSRIDANVKLGTTEQWTFNNHSGEVHPMHIHDIMFQVTSRNGSSPYAWDKGWKDTVAVDGWGSATVKMQFPNANAADAQCVGPYVFHCHKLEHEDYAMMGQFNVS